MSLTIRDATPEDRDRIVLFNQALARETEGRMLDRPVLEAGVAEILSDPAHGRYFVAEDDQGDVVGQLAITLEWSDWRNGDIWWIQSVYIAKEHRRRGIYQALHGHVREAAREAGAVGLRLYVERDNEAARRTYAALGMHPSPYVMYEEFWPTR
ncbi:MAG: GNAT family N-acetyltransferase [Gemmatimonadales bacterium]|jgi:GNAT superfamily N-acetyltransferase